VSIERLDAANRADVEAVAGLHSRYLADSPVVQFGPRFLRDFYYAALVRDGLIGVTLCRADDRVIGFISYTADPLGFMTVGVRRHGIKLAGVMAASVATRPGTARDIAHVLRLMRERRGEAASGAPDNTGEVLSLVVDEAYRGYVPPGGKSRVAVRLFEASQDFFREHGLGRVRLLVQPGNIESNLFCNALGCEFEKITAGGGSVHRYTYSLPVEPAREVVS